MTASPPIVDAAIASISMDRMKSVLTAPLILSSTLMGIAYSPIFLFLSFLFIFSKTFSAPSKHKKKGCPIPIQSSNQSVDKLLKENNGNQYYLINYGTKKYFPYHWKFLFSGEADHLLTINR